jgi:hypothetical protein
MSGQGAWTMPMHHKAYAFDWRAFQRDDLPGLLLRALETGDPSGLAAYVERHRELLKDPDEGDPLGEGWKEWLGNRDVHEYGDYALTRFYDPNADGGLGYCWNEIDDALPGHGQLALLGSPFGPRHHRFDPGRYGSYFQTLRQVAESLTCVRGFDLTWLDEHDRGFLGRFIQLLEECVASGQGLYVTF